MKKPLSFESPELREFAEMLRARRTINLYLQTPVPNKLVMDAIDSARWAPNHHVTEPWRFRILGKETIAACVDLVRTITTERKDAKAADFKAKSWAEKPGWLVLTCEKSDDELTQREDFAACAAAAQNMMLHLWKAGIGTKWVTGPITRDARFYELLGIDADTQEVVGLFWYGYPKLTPTQNRKDLDSIVTTLP